MAVNWGSDSLLWPALLGASSGLLGAAPGQSQFGSGFQGLLGGLHLGAQMQRARREDELQRLQLAQALQQAAARATLLGGLDPRTGITWDTGRQGMSPQEQAATLVAAFPEQAAKRLFPDPKDRFVTVGNQLVDISGAKPSVALSAPNYKERDLPIGNDRVQKQVSYDGGMTWQNVGEPYNRRDPFIIQEIRGEDGTVRQVAIPRASLESAPAAGQPQTTPVASGTQASATVPVPGLPAGSRILGEKPAQMTEAQGKAAGFADRMAASNEVLNRLESQGTSIRGRLFQSLPGGNFFQSDDFQKFEQAKRDFINAVLRRESGATITPEEFANAEKQYFPQPGDSPEVIKQKRRNREIAVQAMIRDAGPTYRPRQTTQALDDPLGIR